MFENVRGDINRAKWDRDEFLAAGGWTKTTWLSTFRVLIAQSTWSVFAHRFAHWATLCRIPVVRQVLLVFAVILSGCAKRPATTQATAPAPTGAAGTTAGTGSSALTPPGAGAGQQAAQPATPGAAAQTPGSTARPAVIFTACRS